MFDMTIEQFRLIRTSTFVRMIDKLCEDLPPEELYELCVDNLPNAAQKYEEAQKRWMKYIDEAEEEFKKGKSKRDKDIYKTFKEWKAECEYVLPFEGYLERCCNIKIVDEPGIHFEK